MFKTRIDFDDPDHVRPIMTSFYEKGMIPDYDWRAYRSQGRSKFANIKRIYIMDNFYHNERQVGIDTCEDPLDSHWRKYHTEEWLELTDIRTSSEWLGVDKKRKVVYV